MCACVLNYGLGSRLQANNWVVVCMASCSRVMGGEQKAQLFKRKGHTLLPHHPERN